ncbi:MAG: extracellular solute-binding protein, partial [Anaerolineaceae bacterium]|nr:extracellular solute-binding protein [Anaerolineaceae bacterium]
WVPPAFDPANGTQGSEILRSRLDAFMSQNPGVQVVVRVKADNGPAGLLESLASANAVAPKAMPSLVLLSRSDLETAALKGLIQPQDGLSAFSADEDWYPVARQMATIQDRNYGLPFAADALVLVYRPARLGMAPADWNSILRLGQTMAFPAADPQGLVTLTLYQSTGGIIMDALRRPMLQPEELTRVLEFYAEGARLGSFPYWLTQLQTDDQVWEAFRAQRTHAAITWISSYLGDLPLDASAVPLPVLGEKAFTLGRGWLWCLSDPLPERRALSMKLAEYLVESEFLTDWSSAAGYLPPRPSSVAALPDQGVISLLEQIALAANLRPANELVGSLGPVLQDAVIQIIRNQSQPAEAAQAAVDTLNRP